MPVPAPSEHAPPPPAEAGLVAPALLALGGVAAAFGVAACCALPLLFASLGLGTAVLANVGLVAIPWRGDLAVAALASLAAAAFLLARPVRGVAPCDIAARRRSQRLIAAIVALGAVLLVAGQLYG